MIVLKLAIPLARTYDGRRLLKPPSRTNHFKYRETEGGPVELFASVGRQDGPAHGWPDGDVRLAFSVAPAKAEAVELHFPWFY